MKNIRVRANGLYEARKIVNGKRQSLYGRNLRELQKKLTTLKHSALLLPSKIKVKSLYNYSIEWAKLYKMSFLNIKQYKDLCRLIEKLKGSEIDIPVNQIDCKKLQKFYNKFPPSRTKELLSMNLKAIFNRVVRDGFLKFNPMEDVKKDKKIVNIRPPFTFEEQKQVLKALEGSEIKDYILIYLFTGIRKNELDLKHIKDEIVDNVLRVKCEKNVEA